MSKRTFVGYTTEGFNVYTDGEQFYVDKPNHSTFLVVSENPVSMSVLSTKN